MAESIIHMNLLKLLKLYVKRQLKIDSGFILSDDSGSSIGNIPPIINDYRPDIYARSKDLLIIGDAKTEGDWDRHHSLAQYKSYYKECADYIGNAVFLIAVPWHVERSVKNRLIHMFPNSGTAHVTIIVISDMWREENAKN